MKIRDINEIDEKFIEFFAGKEIYLDVDRIIKQEGYLDAIFVMLKNNIKLKDKYNTDYRLEIDKLSESLIIDSQGLINKVYYITGEVDRTKQGNNNIVLPLGSVVKLFDDTECMIIGRANSYEIEGLRQFTDYEGVPYPIGHSDGQVTIFNHDDIVELLFVGAQDDGHMTTTAAIKDWLDNNKIIPKYVRK